MEPRGIRNNNPGNLNYVGQAGAHNEQGDHGRFAVFSTAEAGLMALRGQLLRYHQRDGLDSISAIISKWAPPAENNTHEYIEGVAHALGVSPDTPLGNFSPHLMAGLMQAIIMMENGKNPHGSLIYQVAGLPAQENIT
ncbi:structural protein P5 [Saccharibacter floricola]|uniref:Bacteriophage protein n=1 Tax=Saccharibacter floricola DSM 15669 TaxID=1123227 RepID=A0ABQ0P0X9_9PROT|nr:structural protein P5 [Saccharibacter floricola]GBQ07856.1 bacteriophage protein [Saccharibacter floricola DSM 15669]